MASQQERTVVVTGFGLFRDHKSNPSWESIRDGRLKIDRPGIRLITKQVDVCYETVDAVVEDLWQTYHPWLVIHVGLAAHESSIRLEQIARHGPYVNNDIKSCAPHVHLRGDQHEKGHYQCLPCNFDHSKTCINIDEICDKLNSLFQQGQIALPVKKSCDAGLYVCEYIYHKSLSISDRAVFIHVPDVVNFKLDDITLALKYTIETIIDQMSV